MTLAPSALENGRPVVAGKGVHLARNRFCAARIPVHAGEHAQYDYCLPVKPLWPNGPLCLGVRQFYEHRRSSVAHRAEAGCVDWRAVRLSTGP